MLDELERRILTLHNGFCCRNTLAKAAEIGELLIQAKGELIHGKWSSWVKRLGISPRTAQTYIQLAKTQPVAGFPEQVTMNQFLSSLRVAKRQAREVLRQENRQEQIAAIGKLDSAYVVKQADCRKFSWPETIDCVATDPPWEEMSAYKWLADFAADRLREGGSLLVQCGTTSMAEVMAILGKRLRYQWTLAIVYQQAFAMSHLPLAISWRPVLLFTKGKWNIEKLERVSDTVTVPLGGNHKSFFEWEQPLPPWQHWLTALTRPGELIADPFCGVGTFGLAAKLAGGRRFIGTELDRERAKVARSRLAA